jgi:CPA1 family monovalent cation:H+ antiporter
MPGGTIHEAQVVLIILLVFIVGFGILAQRLKIAYPIVFVLGGLLVSFIPALPAISLYPDFIFLTVLPPLLFAAATQTSWAEFKYNLVSITSLAFGLVGFTVLGVSFAAHWLIPGFDWRLGLVLGAAVAPTDAIAATAIAQRLGLPKRIVDLLEGESLVNDASGLVALQFSTALVASGSVPSLSGGVLRLLSLVAGGILIGVIIARVSQFVDSHVDNARIEIALSIVTPYAAYSAAEAAGVSGVLATVAAGLYLGRQTSVLFSSRVRIESQSFWGTLTFLLNGIVFLLIGLELPTVLGGIRSISPSELLISALELCASVILLRLIWVLPAAYVGYFIRRQLLHQSEERPSLGAVFFLGWTGMRGVVSLAAAIALPITLSNGQPFPQRNPLIFLTFSVILVTLVLQGLTLPTLIRALKLSSSDASAAEERKARRIMVSAALKRIEELREKDKPEFDSLYDAFARLYQQRLSVLTSDAGTEDNNGSENTGSKREQHYRAVAKQLRDTERATVMSLRASNDVSDGVLRTLQRELDLLELRDSGV